MEPGGNSSSPRRRAPLRPLPVRISLTEDDIAAARAPESIVLEPPDMADEADPQVRAVVIQIETDN
jgi:hypothetical protein